MSSLNVPAAQGTQTLKGMSNVSPSGHTQSDKNVLAGSEVFPMGQSMQVASLTAATVEEYVPALHCVHSSKPREALKYPPTHASHGCPGTLV